MLCSWLCVVHHSRNNVNKISWLKNSSNLGCLLTTGWRLAWLTMNCTQRSERYFASQFQPNWESLDNRPLPDWYDKAKVGIFLHWGVYSVPSIGSEWFWNSWVGGDAQCVDFIKKFYPANWTYQDFAREFTAELYDPLQWAELFKKAGAKYVVLTGKHHEGYALWPSAYCYSWNSNDVGAHRDLLGDLGAAVKKYGLRFGIYHSLLEWYHPIFKQDMANNWKTSTYVDSKIIPEMKELVNTYKPDIFWSDGNWEGSDTYWKTTEFLTWLFNKSPVKDKVVTNDRWGSNTQCVHGDFYTCADRYNPGVLLPHKWENAMSVDKISWGYRRNAPISDILTARELVVTLVETVSCGGNILINIGPTKEGTIVPIFQERLLQLGTWLEINGEAIYESNPWTVQRDTLTSSVWYTTKKPVVYAMVLDWPDTGVVRLASPLSLFNTNTKVVLLGNTQQISWKNNSNEIAVTLPNRATVKSEWAWVLKITP